jgi:outer membrane receptor protein involved in Fe transport
MIRNLGGVALAAGILAPALTAQQQPDTTRRPAALDAVTVTATRTERTTFDTPQPITVIDSATIASRLPNGIADLFRDIAGLDASGVGPNQRRPEIRLQRGQRILLLEDGLRLNNARRQQDFGELPALAGLDAVRSVEVVRGPSSVLYGTDAIGGVVNLLTARPPRRLASGDVSGTINLRYGSAGQAASPSGSIAARYGRFGFTTDFAYREAEDYTAPAGSFGDITLATPARVNDSGIRDRSLAGRLSYDLTGASELFARAEIYTADEAGFGWIDPSRLGQGQPTIQILYPDQAFTRYTLGYRALGLSLPVAHRAEITAYTQRNKRHLDNLIFVPMGPAMSMDSRSFNYTDLETYGGRVELARGLGRHLLTYGADAFQDDSRNTDSSWTYMVGFGPAPITRTSNTPSVPNAVFRSAGLFTQLELHPVDRLTTIVGGRIQNVFAETRPTPNVSTPLVEGSSSTAVWSANALYRITEHLNVITAVGRGFRAPNIVEQFFEGPAPEGNGYQRANTSLSPETNINVDLGLRFRRGVLYAESFVFRNDIANAIRAEATGETVNGLPAYQNHNVGKLRVDGLELLTGVNLPLGLGASVSFTRFEGTNVTFPTSPVGDSYASKVVGDIEYGPAGRWFTLGYTVRHQGEQKDVIVGTNPIGEVIPAFTLHSARASARLFERFGVRNTLVLSAENLGNTLYAEFPNASFFRPEPGRSLRVSLVTSF